LSQVKSIVVERASAERLRLVAGDLLLNEGGDRDKIGRGWVWDGTIPDMIHQNHVFRVRLHSKLLNPFFVSHYANEMGRQFFIDEGKQPIWRQSASRRSCCPCLSLHLRKR